MKLKTPKQERKKDVDTPLRVEDLRCSQHFGSQIDVTWECNSPDALRNLQRCKYTLLQMIAVCSLFCLCTLVAYIANNMDILPFMSKINFCAQLSSVNFNNLRA